MSDYSHIEIPWRGWRIVREIGRGSFGVVYEIERDIVGAIEKAAMKVMHIPRDESAYEMLLLSTGYDEASVERSINAELNRVLKEYALMSKLKGISNIVSCEDFSFTENENGRGYTVYIRMELLRSLQEVIKAKRKAGETFTEAEVVRLGMDICRALTVCEKNGIIHRDVKPQNILISKHGAYNLGDFGTARSLDHTTQATYAGTLSYMAPEVYKHEKYGKTVDIYSLGLVMYWLMNGYRMPFLPQSGVPTTEMLSEAENKRVSGEHLPAPFNASEGLSRIILKACAYKSEDRYSTAADMLRDLEDLSRASASRQADAAADSKEPAAAGAASTGNSFGMPSAEYMYYGNEETLPMSSSMLGIADGGEIPPADQSAESEPASAPAPASISAPAPASASISEPAPASISDDAPAADHAPVADDVPVADHASVAEDALVTDAASAADEPVLPEEEPVAELNTPASVPAADGEPVADKALADTKAGKKKAKPDGQSAAAKRKRTFIFGGILAAAFLIVIVYGFVSAREIPLPFTAAQFVSTGDCISAAIDEDGGLWTWGANSYGQLGNGKESKYSKPAKILDDVRMVSMGYNHAGAVKTDGSLWMWGYNVYGQLGDGTTYNQLEPVKVMDDVEAVSAGYDFSAILKTDGSLWTVGYNGYGELGNGTEDISYEPVKIMEDVEMVSASYEYCAAVKTDGTLWTWGKNIDNELGDGTDKSRLKPVKILEDVQKVDTGYSHSAALKTDGSLWMWGDNWNGEIVESDETEITKPIEVMSDVQKVSAGNYFTAVIKTDGSLWTWGANYEGQLGIGTNESDAGPTKIMENVQAVVAGYYQCATLLEDGSLWMWGDNEYHQIISGSTSSRREPVRVTSE